MKVKSDFRTIKTQKGKMHTEYYSDDTYIYKIVYNRDCMSCELYRHYLNTPVDLPCPDCGKYIKRSSEAWNTPNKKKMKIFEGEENQEFLKNCLLENQAKLNEYKTTENQASK